MVDTKKDNIFASIAGSATLLKFGLFIVLLGLSIYSFNNKRVLGTQVVAGVKSTVYVTYDGKTKKSETYKTLLSEAVQEQGINLYDQDLFSVPRDTRLLGQVVRVVIQKSEPVLIIDNGRRIMGRAAATDPRGILAQNSIEIFGEDKVHSELILDPVAEGAVGRKIVIERAPVYYVLVDGKKKEVRAWESEVGAIVALSQTKINPNDIVSPKKGKLVSSGQIIKITRVNYANVAETRSISFTTVYKGSTSLALGQTKTAQTGITGQKKLTYRITYKNGEEVSRAVLTTKIVRAKRDALIYRGAITGKSQWGPYYETNYGPYTTSFHFPGYVGRYILVTNLATGKSVKVKVVDVGPDRALLDLSTTAFRQIGGSTSHGHIDSIMIQLID